MDKYKNIYLIIKGIKKLIYKYFILRIKLKLDVELGYFKYLEKN